jgi:hypothetical protein
LPFRSFAFARSALNMPNANLMACFVVASFYFVSFTSLNPIGFGIRYDERMNVHFFPPAYHFNPRRGHAPYRSTNYRGVVTAQWGSCGRRNTPP